MQNLGFDLEPKKPKVLDIPTNSIWFGEKVNIDDIKVVAYTLIRAGIQIQAIEYFKQPSGSKASLIQVGASRFVVNDPIFTVEMIRALTPEKIRGRSRTYGEQ